MFLEILVEQGGPEHLFLTSVTEQVT